MDWGDPGRTPAARAALAAALALAVVVTFLPAVDFELLTWDDRIYVTSNPLVRDGLTAEAVRGAFRPWEANYIPVTWLSLALDTSLGGGATRTYHLTNVLLHAATAALLFLVLQAATGSTWPAWLAAALWAIHPLRVESVAWVSERKDVLSGLLAVATIGAWVRWTRSPGPGRFALVLAAFAAGLLAKPMLVTLPLVLLLLDAWPLGRLPGGRPDPASTARLLREKLPLLALALVGGVATVLAQRAGGAVVAVETIPPGARIANVLFSAAWYPARTLWPSGLSFFYPFEPVATATAAACGLVLALATAACLAAWRSQPWLAVGWLWYLVMLLPVSGLLQVGEQARADRYAYLPGIGLSVAATWLVASIARNAAARRTALAAGALALAALVPATRAQMAYWRDSESLFRRALAVDPSNYKAHGLLAPLLRDAGDTDGATAHCEEALRLRPNWGFALVARANMLLDAGRPGDALPLLERAVATGDATLAGRNSLGRCLAELDRAPEAETVLRRAIELEETSRADVVAEVGPLLRRSLADALVRQGRLPDAIAAWRDAVRLAPGSADARFELGLALGESGDSRGAIEQLREAARLRPDHAETRFSLAVELQASGDRSAALAEIDAALRLRPGWQRAEAFREGLASGTFRAPGSFED